MAEDLNSIPTPSEGPDARREALSAAFDAMPQTPVPEPAAVAPEPAVAPSGRARDETGKFAKVEAAPAAAALAPEPEPEWAKPPKSWKAEKQALWDGMPPEAREYAFQREQEMAAGVAPLQTKAQFADEMQQAIAPYEQTIRGLGLQPAQAVQQMMEADRILRTAPMAQKQQYLFQLAAQYGIQLDPQAAPQGYQPPDPAFFSLQNELTNIRGEVLGWKQQQEQAQTAQLQSEITLFGSTHEYFEQARPVMQKLLASGMASGLEDAYTQAVRLDPDLFAKSQAAQATKAATEKDQAARIAKAAAVSPRSTTPGAPAANTKPDRRAVIEEAYDSNIEARL